MELDQAIRRDTLANRPAATAVPPGTLYGVTDEGNRIDRSNGLAWEPYGATGGGGGAPAAHHTTHEPGGSDPMAVDAVPATGSLRTLGTGANQAAPGNDARFGGAPAAHHATHEPGGADALTNAAWTNVANTFTQDQTLQGPTSIRLNFIESSQPADLRVFRITGGGQSLQVRAMDDALATGVTVQTYYRDGSATIGNNLSVTGSGGNVACKDQANTFSQDQKLTKTNPRVKLVDSAQAANQKHWEMLNASTNFYIQQLTDVEGAVAPTAFQLDRLGNAYIGANVYEKSRTTPLGHWQNTPFNAAHYTAVGGGTWTIAAAAIIQNRFTLIGKTLHWSLYISWFSGGNVIAGTVSALNISLPPPFTHASQNIFDTVAYCQDGGLIDVYASPGGANIVSIKKRSGANFTVAGAPGLIGITTWEIT